MLKRMSGREHMARARRIRVDMPMILELNPGFQVKALLNDVSEGGFRLTSRALLHAGQSVMMRMPRETLACQLCWVNGRQAAGVFLQSPKPDRW